MVKKIILQYFCIIAGVLAITACATGPATVVPSTSLPDFPPARFAVFTDPHLHTAALGMTGKEFWNNVNQGKKLLHLSEEILGEVVSAIVHDPDIQFVVIPGDLTKDGERENHLRLVTYLEKIEAAGKKVYVIPGNHDIQNFHARRYTEKGAIPVPSITAAEFAKLYQDFGYGEAISRDEHSLSYVAEPVPGLWLFGFDVCIYETNSPEHPMSTGGRFRKETLIWAEEWLALARKRGKAVLGCMHHGILEHFRTQKKYFSAYVVDDYNAASRRLASAGLRFMFTGHFHAQDIVLERFPGDAYLYDIETASLVTWPCAWRILEFTIDNKLIVTSHPVTTLPSLENFQDYAQTELANGVEEYLAKYLKRYHFSRNDLSLLTPQLVRGMIAHTAGDETPPPVLIEKKGFSLGMVLFLLAADDLVQGVWHDPPPADNNLQIDYRSGIYQRLDRVAEGKIPPSTPALPEN